MCAKMSCKKKPISHKAFKWKIYYLSSVKTVQYCSILERKRTFYQLIGNYYSQIDHHKVVCCDIIKADLLLVENAEIFILFLPKIRRNSYLGFKMIVEKVQLMPECNNLLLFLKKSDNLYLSSNNLFVQCETDVVWKCFYHLYELFLMKPVRTVVSMEFYCSFICDQMINNEKLLLHILKAYKKFPDLRNPKYSRKKNMKQRKLSNVLHKQLLHACNKNYEYERTVHVPNKTCKMHSTLGNPTLGTHVSGFRTASGKKITISDEAKQKACARFGDYLCSGTIAISETFRTQSLNDNGKSNQFSKITPMQPAVNEALQINESTNTTSESAKAKWNDSQQYSLNEKLTVMENVLNNDKQSCSVLLGTDKNLNSKHCFCKKIKWNSFSNFGRFSIACYTDMVKVSTLSADVAKSILKRNINNLSDSFSSSFSGQSVYGVIHDSSFQEKPASNLLCCENLTEKFCDPVCNDLKNVQLAECVSGKKSFCLSPKPLVKQDFTETATFKQLDAINHSKNSICYSENAFKSAFSASQTDFSQNSMKLLEKETALSSKVSVKELPKFQKFGFQTASGKAVSISASAMSVAQNIFKEICNEDDASNEVSQLGVKKEKGEKNCQLEEIGGNWDRSKGLKRAYPECLESEEYVPDRFFEEVSFDEKDAYSSGKSENVPFQPPVLTSGVAFQAAALGCKRKKSLGGRRRIGGSSKGLQNL